MITNHTYISIMYFMTDTCDVNGPNEPIMRLDPLQQTDLREPTHPSRFYY